MSLFSLAFVLIAFRLGKIWLITVIAVNAVLMNIFATKGIYLFGLATTGGNILYASIFLATDLLDEYYGKKEAFRAVMIGFFASVFSLLATQSILKFSPADYDIAQESLKTIFSLTPRIIFASMIAYLISQNLDVWSFMKIKKMTNGRHLWLRNNASTITSQLADSIIFTLIAFWGVYPNIWQLILFTYIIKVIIAVMDTPFIYLSKIFKPKELAQ
jgi:hypothetical protein